ncbi:MAG: hypothetical protein WBC91_00765 [Phototrophicaceae bacterium]
MNPPLRLLAAFQKEAHKEPQHIVQIDERQMWVAAEVTGGFPYTIIVPDMDVRTTFDRRSAKLKKTLRNRPLPQWAYYMAGAVAILDRDGFDMAGATLVIAGDEPAGPRYHHALGIAFVAFWYQINDKPYTSQTLIDLMEKVRHNYIQS